MDEKSIVQINSVVLRHDALDNVMQTINMINLMEGYESSIVADLFSEYDHHPILASQDYDKSPLSQKMSYALYRFLWVSKKAHWLKKYMKAKMRYKKGVAKERIEKADVRIWHYGAFYTLFRYFHAGDVLFYHGITYPNLSYFSEFGIYSKNMLQAILDMYPFVIVQSNFIKEGLIALGFKKKSIHVLPLFHVNDLKYMERNPNGCKLIAWGRYALNKSVPELVKMANENGLSLRVFGDNTTLKEFVDQYKEAKAMNTRGYATLTGKVPDFEAELNQANIYISNSGHEGFGLPLIEAESYSIPVLARRGTSMDELVKDGYNGFLFSDIGEVPELVARIMQDYRKFSYNAWKHSQNFTYEKFKGRYLRILKEYVRKERIERHKRY